MKVALVDNMNNNFFAIARYLRDLGADAHLYLIPNSSHSHFDPQADTFHDLKHVDWIKAFPFDYSVRSIFKLKGKLFNIFHDYDYVIACGQSVGFLYASGIEVDMFIPYGSDLYDIPFFRSPDFCNPVKYLAQCLVRFLRSSIQSKGIKRSATVISNTNWVMAEKAATKLGVRSTNLPRLMIYPEITDTSLDPHWTFMSDYDFKVFSPTRHLWKTNLDPMPDFLENGGMKRNDKLIRAFARVVDLGLFDNPCLILFEFGYDVEHSKALIKELGMEKRVIWKPLLPRKIIMQGMARASIVADQFRVAMSATSSGITNEALAVGVAVVANTDGAIFDPHDPYFGAPILDAIEEDQIVSIFTDFAADREKYVAIGKAGQDWFKRNLGVGLAEKYLLLLTTGGCK